jgi:hypothetical protein
MPSRSPVRRLARQNDEPFERRFNDCIHDLTNDLNALPLTIKPKLPCLPGIVPFSRQSIYLIASQFSQLQRCQNPRVPSGVQSALVSKVAKVGPVAVTLVLSTHSTHPLSNGVKELALKQLDWL